MKTNSVVTALQPSRFNMMNATHASHAPVKCAVAVAYMSGNREITEFRVSREGFEILVWTESRDGSKQVLSQYSPPEWGADRLWTKLELDCLSGKARLSDRASVRGVGSVPSSRSMNRATDDVSSVVNWLRRAEKWLSATGGKGRPSAEGGTADYSPSDIADAVIVPVKLTGAILPPTDARCLRVGSVKHWDVDGALSVRGKRTHEGASSRSSKGKKERIQILRETAQRQLARAVQEEGRGDPDDLVPTLLEWANECERTACALQGQLDERMAAARAARAVKLAAKNRAKEVAVSVEAAAVIDNAAETKARLETVSKGESSEDADSAE